MVSKLKVGQRHGQAPWGVQTLELGPHRTSSTGRDSLQNKAQVEACVTSLQSWSTQSFNTQYVYLHSLVRLQP